MLMLLLLGRRPSDLVTRQRSRRLRLRDRTRSLPLHSVERRDLLSLVFPFIPMIHLVAALPFMRAAPLLCVAPDRKTGEKGRLGAFILRLTSLVHGVMRARTSGPGRHFSGSGGMLLLLVMTRGLLRRSQVVM